MSGEPDHAYMAFCDWVRCACPPIPEFVQTIAHNGDSVRKWSRRWDWTARAEASPYGAQLARVAAGIERRVAETAEGMEDAAWFRRLAKRAGVLYATRLEMAEAIGQPVELSASDIQKLSATARLHHEMSRLDAGQSTANVAIGTATIRGRTFGADDLDGMTPAQLDALRQLAKDDAVAMTAGEDDDDDAP
jgi:hypothetical protein